MSDPSFDTLFSFLRQPSLIPGPIRLLLHTAASSLVVLGTTSKSPAACLRSPQKKRDIKRLFFFFFLSRRVLSTRVSLNPPCLSVCKRSGGGGTPFGSLCVRAGEEAKAHLVFPAETAPRLKLSH